MTRSTQSDRTTSTHSPTAPAARRRRRRALGASAAGVAMLVSAPAAFAAVSPTDDGQTRLITKSASGTSWGDKTSTRARISQNGQYVVYQSAAQNLTSDHGGGIHVYLTDLSGQIVPGGNNTRLVDADATTPNLRCKTKAGTNGQSTINEVSNQRGGDGPWVVFSSNCFNLVPGWQHTGDVYIRNMKSGVTQVVSQANGDNSQPIAPVSVRPVISDDGRYVAWNSTTGDIFVRDMLDNTSQRSVRVVASTGGDDESLRPEISGDGSHVIFASDAQLAPQDTNTKRDIYLVDLRGWQANKNNTSFTEVIADLGSNGQVASRPASRPGINATGTIVTFETAAPLVSDDTNGVLDAYWRNMSSGQTVLLSRGWAGDVPNGQSSRPQLDDSGYVAAFTSTSNALVKGDTNGRPDAFIRKINRTDPTQGTNFLISQRPNGDVAGALDDCANTTPTTVTGPDGTLMPMARPGNQNISTRPYLDGDASRVVFVSGMCDLVDPVTDGISNQIYVRTYGPGGPTAR